MFFSTLLLPFAVQAFDIASQRHAKVYFVPNVAQVVFQHFVVRDRVNIVHCSQILILRH